MAQHRVSTRRRHRESDVVVLVIDICLERKIFKYGDSKAKAERTPSLFSYTFMLHQIAYTWRMERGINTILIRLILVKTRLLVDRDKPRILIWHLELKSEYDSAQG